MTRKAPPHAWPKGQSGNPKGRPAGASKLAKLREGIAKDVPDIIKALTAAAKAGDVGAARLLLERAVPAVRPVELPVNVDMAPDASLSEQARAVLAAVAAGDLGAQQAAALLGAIGTAGRIAEGDELRQRIEALEAAAGKQGGQP